MQTLEEFREAIASLVDNRANGISEEDEKLLEYLDNSPDSLKFALQEIESEDTSNFPVLFQSIIIVANFVSNDWSSFETNDKDIIIQTLLNFIINLYEKNPAINKAIACIANIIASEIYLFDDVLQNLPPQAQIDFIIFLIEELNDRKYDQPPEIINEYDSYLTDLCPTVLQMLDELPLSIEFLDLSRVAILCFSSYEFYEPFMDKFELALDEPLYFQYCTMFVRTILVSSSKINFDEPTINIIIRIMKFSMALSFEYVNQKIFDTPCEIWDEISNFNPLLFEDSGFAKYFLSELLKFLPSINVGTFELQQLMYDVCCTFTDESFPTYSDELIQIFEIVLHIMDFTWSNTLDLCCRDICSKIPDIITQILYDQLQSPSPGLFLAAIQCDVSNEFLSELSIQAIKMKDTLPLSHLLTFIHRRGIKFPEFKDQWLDILLDCFPFQPSNSINCIVSLLKNYPDLIPTIPQEFLSDFLEVLDSSGRTSVDIWVKGIQLFNYVISDLPDLFLEKLNDFILMLTQDAIKSENFDRYYEYIKKINDALKNVPDNDQFKRILLDNVFDLLCEILTLKPEELQENRDAMGFFHSLSLELKVNL